MDGAVGGEGGREGGKKRFVAPLAELATGSNGPTLIADKFPNGGGLLIPRGGLIELRSRLRSALRALMRRDCVCTRTIYGVFVGESFVILWGTTVGLIGGNETREERVSAVRLASTLGELSWDQR